MGYISIPDFSVVGELHYLRDACGYLMKSIRTGRCFIDFGGYLPNSISTEVERFRVAPWLCFGARNVDILDRIKPPMPQFGFPMGTFVDEDVQLDTKAISNKLTYNKPWRFMNKVSGFHPDNKCTRARPGKGDTTCTEILKRLIDEDKHIIWEKVFMVRANFPLSCFIKTLL